MGSLAHGCAHVQARALQKFFWWLLRSRSHQLAEVLAISHTVTPQCCPMFNPTPRITHRWQCPDCDNGITLHVRVKHAPVCNNKAAHSRRHIEMKREKKGDQQ